MKYKWPQLLTSRNNGPDITTNVSGVSRMLINYSIYWRVLSCLPVTVLWSTMLFWATNSSVCSDKCNLVPRCTEPGSSTNQRPVTRSRDHSGPIRGHPPGPPTQKAWDSLHFSPIWSEFHVTVVIIKVLFHRNDHPMLHPITILNTSWALNLPDGGHLLDILKATVSPFFPVFLPFFY